MIRDADAKCHIIHAQQKGKKRKKEKFSHATDQVTTMVSVLPSAGMSSVPSTRSPLQLNAYCPGNGLSPSVLLGP